MSSRPTRLRMQLSLAIFFSAVLAISILILGMVGFYLFMQNQRGGGLSEENRNTLESQIANNEIDPEALTTLVSVFVFSWTEKYAAKEMLLVFSFAALAIVFALGLVPPSLADWPAQLKLLHPLLKPFLREISRRKSKLITMTPRSLAIFWQLLIR